MAEKYLTVADAANVADVAEGTIYRWLREGELTRHKQRHRTFICERELADLLYVD